MDSAYLYIGDDMNIFYVLLIPVIFSIAVWFVFKKQIVWWEVLVVVGVSLLFITGGKFLAEEMMLQEKEYWGNYVVSVHYEEQWTEYVHATCSRTYACGTDSKGNTTYCTEYYDCSYYDTHPEMWYVRLNDGRVIYVNENKYNELLWKFKQPQVFVDMERERYHDMEHYRCKDGNMYMVSYGGEFERIEPVITENSYENRVIHSRSLFNFDDIEDTTGLNLFPKLPNIFGFYEASSIRGFMMPGFEEANRMLTNWNGLLGMSKEVRIQMILYANRPYTQGELLKQYWKGGNMNEFNIIVSVDSNTYKPQWVQIISWTPNEELKISVRDMIATQDSLDLMKTVLFVGESVELSFVRKDFHEFDYLDVEPPTWAVWIIVIVTILISVFGLGWSVVNEFDYDGSTDYSYYSSGLISTIKRKYFENRKPNG